MACASLSVRLQFWVTAALGAVVLVLYGLARLRAGFALGLDRPRWCPAQLYQLLSDSLIFCIQDPAPDSLSHVVKQPRPGAFGGDVRACTGYSHAEIKLVFHVAVSPATLIA